MYNPHMLKEYLVLTQTENLVIETLTKQPDGLSISEISVEVNLARTSIYSAIDSLLQKHLVIKNDFIYALQGQLQRKTLWDIPASEQIQKLMEELLELKKGEIIYSVESDEEIKELFKTPKELMIWQKAIAKKKIVLKGVGAKNAVHILRTMASAELLEHIGKRSGAARITSEEIRAACTLVSFRGSVVFFSRKRGFFYRIDNAEVAKFTQSIIDLLYNHLEYQKIA